MTLCKFIIYWPHLLLASKTSDSNERKLLQKDAKEDGNVINAWKMQGMNTGSLLDYKIIKGNLAFKELLLLQGHD